MDIRRITVLMAVHNRWQMTDACLRSIEAQDGSFQVDGVVVDDGSDDETPRALKEFRWLTVLRCNGTAFWAQAMSLAEQEAETWSQDAVLWLNNDVVLAPDALANMVRTATLTGADIVVGTTMDPETGTVNYGGKLRVGLNPLKFTLVGATEDPIQVDGFSGNCLLVRSEYRHRAGPIDGSFAHAFADDDYALRAKRLGAVVIQAPGTVGTCPSNFGQIPKTLRERLGFLRDPKGLPLPSLVRFLMMHSKWLWPYFLTRTILSVLMGFRAMKQEKLRCEDK